MELCNGEGDDGDGSCALLAERYFPASDRHSEAREAFYAAVGLVSKNRAEKIKAVRASAASLLEPERIRRRERRSRRRAREVPLAADADASDEHDDACALCCGLGELLMCTTCTRVYHLTCVEPPLYAVPEGDWFCPTCVQRPGQAELDAATAATGFNPMMLESSYNLYKQGGERELLHSRDEVATLRAYDAELTARTETLDTSISEATERLLKCTRDMQQCHRIGQACASQLVLLFRAAGIDTPPSRVLRRWLMLLD